MQQADISKINSRTFMLPMIGILAIYFSLHVHGRENQIQSVENVQQSSGSNGDEKSESPLKR
jgi:hypothetical protein